MIFGEKRCLYTKHLCLAQEHNGKAKISNDNVKDIVDKQH